MNTPKRKTTSLRLSDPVREKLEYLAKRQNRSINNLVDTLLAQVLGLRDSDEENELPDDFHRGITKNELMKGIEEDLKRLYQK
jgi:predicted transcriptional regulator